MLRDSTAWAGYVPVPTPLSLGLAGLGLGVALLFGWREALLYDLALLLACVLDCMAAPGEEEILAERRCPVYASQGLEQVFEIELRNLGARPRRVRVRDQTPLEWAPAPVLTGVVAAGSSMKVHYGVIPPERGVFAFAGIHVRVEGPLGLGARSVLVPAGQEVKVFPVLQPLRYADLATYRRTSHLWGLTRASRLGEGREFEELREYVEGDDPRKIHWKATARLDRPIVQEFRPEKNQNVILVLDTGRLMCALTEGKTKLDHAMDSAVQLAHAAMAGGDQPGLLAFAEGVLCFVPPGRTPAQFRRILEGTLPLRPRLVEPQYEKAFLWLRSRIQRRSLVVIYTDVLDEAASENLLDAVALLKPRHLPLCIAVRETEWDAHLNRPVTDLGDLYERSVLQETLRRRKGALKRLLQKGVMAMDLPASELTPGVMGRYLEVKRKGMI